MADDETVNRVVIADGPRWWGDPTLDGAGLPIRIEDPAIRRARSEAAAAELAGCQHALGQLPPGTLVLHTAERGAPMAFSTAAAVLGLPVGVFPRWPSADGAQERDTALAAVIAGLREAGWRARVLLARPEEGIYGGVTPNLTDTASLLAALDLAGASILPVPVYPYFPPPPPDPDATEETAADPVA